MYSQLSVGERLKVARKDAGFTQDELGNLIGVGKSQISNIEKGTSELTRANAIVFSEKLGISLNWLLHGTGNMSEDSGGINYSNKGKANVNAGGSVQYGTPTTSTDCEHQLQLARLEIEGLKRELATKDQLISVLMKSHG